MAGRGREADQRDQVPRPPSPELTRLNAIVGTWERTEDGTNWLHWMDLEFHKVDAG